MNTTSIETLSLLLIAVNLWISYKGFIDYAFQQKYLFHVDAILRGKEYYRMLSSGFLHGGWWHLGFNMYALYAFSLGVGAELGLLKYLMIYFGSLVLGNALALYIHRNHGDYSAVGASGAISGVIFASIVLHPNGSIGLVFLPGLFIPSWIFGILYMAYTIIGIKRQSDGIGHEAHLGGAMAGVVLALVFEPTLFTNFWHLTVAFILLAISGGFLYAIVKNPSMMLIDGFGLRQKGLKQFQETAAKKQKAKRKWRKVSGNLQDEMDYLLDKIAKEGYENLTEQEQKRLDIISKKLRK